MEKRTVEEKNVDGGLGIPDTEMFDLFQKQRPALLKWYCDFTCSLLIFEQMIVCSWILILHFRYCHLDHTVYRVVCRLDRDDIETNLVMEAVVRYCSLCCTDAHHLAHLTVVECICIFACPLMTLRVVSCALTRVVTLTDLSIYTAIDNQTKTVASYVPPASHPSNTPPPLVIPESEEESRDPVSGSEEGLT